MKLWKGLLFTLGLVASSGAASFSMCEVDMSTVDVLGIIAALANETPSAPTGIYTPMRVVMAGASFETTNACEHCRPHTHEHLQAIMAPKGHVLKSIGDPGALMQDIVDEIVAYQDTIQNVLNASYYRIDAGIVGLSGEQISDSYAEPYTTLALVSDAVEGFEAYARKVYALRPASVRDVDWCFIRNVPSFTDDGWEDYIAAWDAHMAANHPDVGIIDAYAGFTDSKNYGVNYEPWGDWHLSTASAQVAAKRIWERLEAEIVPVNYNPEGWEPESCPELQ